MTVSPSGNITLQSSRNSPPLAFMNDDDDDDGDNGSASELTHQAQQESSISWLYICEEKKKTFYSFPYRGTKVMGRYIYALEVEKCGEENNQIKVEGIRSI